MHRACYVARELWPHVRIALAGYRMQSQRPAPRHSLFLSDATGNYVHARSTVVRDWGTGANVGKFHKLVAK
jgi:hypothetical protein